MKDITQKELMDIVSRVLETSESAIKRARMKILPISEDNAILEVEVHYVDSDENDYTKAVMSALIENSDFSNVERHFNISLQHIKDGE